MDSPKSKKECDEWFKRFLRDYLHWSREEPVTVTEKDIQFMKTCGIEDFQAKVAEHIEKSKVAEEANSGGKRKYTTKSRRTKKQLRRRISRTSSATPQRQKRVRIK